MSVRRVVVGAVGVIAAAGALGACGPGTEPQSLPLLEEPCTPFGDDPGASCYRIEGAYASPRDALNAVLEDPKALGQLDPDRALDVSTVECPLGPSHQGDEPPIVCTVHYVGNGGAILGALAVQTRPDADLHRALKEGRAVEGFIAMVMRPGEE